ncbi:arginase [Gongronella butleri]|nr:arginase [Gongronella butleri]
MTNNKFLSSNKVSIIGAPFNGGQPQAGVEKGPLRLVEYGLANQLQEMGYSVEYEANEDLDKLKPAEDPVVQNLKNPKYVSNVTRHLATQIEERAKRGDFVLTLGGDHSVALATVSGVFAAYPDACLLWIDAHADINTPEATDSGNVHGCPLSFLTGLSTDHPDFAWVKPVLATNRLAYIGLRDADDFEKKILKEHNITAFSMHHVDKWGIGQCVEKALAAINPNGDRPIHLSFDVDALDPSVAPSTGTPVRGGLTFREGHYICEAVAETGNLVAADIMECNPDLEDDEAAMLTIQVGCSLSRCALGETLL